MLDSKRSDNTNLKFFLDGYCFKPIKKKEYRLGNITLAIRKKQIQSYKHINENHIKQRKSLTKRSANTNGK